MGAPQYEQAGADIGGSGTANTIPRWTGASTLGDSIITQTGSTRITVGSGAYAGASLEGVRLTNGVNSYFTASDGTRTVFMGADGNAVVGTLTAHDLKIRAGNADAITVQQGTLNVGIGTASPAARVNVDGNAVYNNTATQAFRVSNGSTRVVDIGYDSGLEKAFIQPVQLGTAYRDLLLAPNGGNVAIGTATPATANSRLTVAGGFIATAAGFGVYQAGDHLTLSGGAGKNVHLKPNDGGVLAVNVGATSCDMSAVSGYGLKLPATPGNADTQTLDCYAEGTWTPTLAGFVTNTPGTVTATYTRIGRMVTLNVYLYAGGSSFGSTLGTTTVTVPSGMTPNFVGVGIGGLSRTTGTVAQAIAYYDGKIYLGTSASAATEMWVSVTYYV